MNSKMPWELFKTRFNGRKIFKSVLIIFTFSILFSTNSFADKPDPWTGPIVNTPGSDNNNPNAHPPHGASAPFDAGLTLLIAAGIGYGVKRSYNKRKSLIRESGHDEPIY